MRFRSHRTLPCLVRALGLLATISGGVTAYDGSSVSGRVLDESGSPVANAMVTCQSGAPVPTRSAGQSVVFVPPQKSIVRSSKDGAFTIAGVQPGIYYLCTYGASGIHLASCEWTGAREVQVAAHQAVEDIALRLVEGAKLKVIVEDPNGRIRDPTEGWSPGTKIQLIGANFRVGVIAGTHYAPARLISAGMGSRIYEVLIPKNLRLRLFVSTSLPITDVDGISIVAGQPGAVVSDNGQTAVPYHMKVL
jgi:hypothetical protein